MHRPPLSFLEEELTLGKKMAYSANATRKAKFADKNGIKTGYFKPCDPNTYPVLLAKYVVAFSVFVRAALGTRAAEERLVYNTKGDIIGSVSLQVPDFVPLLTQADDNYTNPLHQKWGNPDKQTLIDLDVASLLVSAYKHKNDDLHPANISVNGLIDFDELYIELTSILKGVRTTSGWLSNSPQVISDLNENDLRIFPNITKRTHWPTNMVPKNLNVFKNYKTSAFGELKGDPDFTHQHFIALLKELLAYDETMLEERLKLYLSGEDLDLHKLSPEKRKTLLIYGQKEKLFDGQEDEKINPFIKHCLRFYRSEHTKFENMVIHMPEFQEFILSLNKKPIEYFNLKNWFHNNNKHNAVDYNLDHIDQRYQHILRECFVTPFAKQLESLQSIILTSKIWGEKEVATTEKHEIKIEIADMLTARLLTMQKKEISSEIIYRSNANSKPHETKELTGAILLQTQKHATDLYEQITKRKNIYFEKPVLTIQDNHDFITDMEAILKNAEMKRANYKKWLLETREKLMQIENLAIYIKPLIIEMDMLFNDLESFCKSFRTDILIPMRSADSITYIPQPIGIFTPKKPEEIKIPVLQPPSSSDQSPILRVEQIDDEDDQPATLHHEMSRLLSIWLSTVDKDLIKFAINEARQKYNAKNSGMLRWAFSIVKPPRVREVDDLPIEEIFSAGGWRANSLNTYILKNICALMLEEYNKSDFLKFTNDQWWEKYAKVIALESGLRKDTNNPEPQDEEDSTLHYRALPA